MPRLFPILLLLASASCSRLSPQPATGTSEPDPTYSSVTVTGLVRDPHGPVAGARVRFRGMPEFVTTGPHGRFELPAPASTAARVVAWKAGFFIAGERADSSPLVLNLKPLPAEDCERYAWVDPAPDPSKPHNCANCHDAIYREWSASAHARSATGRHFRNLYEGSDRHGKAGIGWSLLAENPDGAGVCTSCHAPGIGSFNDPAFTDLRQIAGVAARGVHCDFCHKVSDAPNDNIGLTHGRFGLKLLRPAEGQVFFGQLEDANRGDDAYSPLYRQSRYCASCHEGTVLSVHVYSTYSEWLESPARREGKECQTCHMAPTGRMTNVAPGHGGIPRDPRTLSNHRFFAGSQRAMLRDALKVAVDLKPGPAGVRAEIEVRADGAGHRVPTGFVDRNLLLVVEALAGDGSALRAQSGPILPEVAGDGLAGRPGRLYAKLLKDFDGHSPVPFWRAQPEAVDTRLVPGQADRSVFTFPAEAERVRVRVVYRRFWQQQAEVKGWTDHERTVMDQTVPVQADRPTRWSGP
jgi:hypothetical protein